jgi:hypothetical protein
VRNEPGDVVVTKDAVPKSTNTEKFDVAQVIVFAVVFTTHPVRGVQALPSHLYIIKDDSSIPETSLFWYVRVIEIG